VRVTLLPTASGRIVRSPDRAEAAAWLGLAEQASERLRPRVLLTYGGRPASLELMRRARRGGIAVVFHLHNVADADRRVFAVCAAVLVPTDHARRHYARRRGLDCRAPELPLHRDRVVAPAPEPRHLTFVDPVPAKGLAVFARLARVLGRRRPGIPLLVVEGRGGAGLDLPEVTTLHRMADTPDPRDFRRVARAAPGPSLVRETAAPRRCATACRSWPATGALPETLGDAGFLFTLPGRGTPGSGVVPTAATRGARPQ
jgi:hypothetical protein